MPRPTPPSDMGTVVCRTCERRMKAKPEQFGVVDTVNDMERTCTLPRNDKRKCILDYHVTIRERV